ncbi:MAG TPA: branched-chain amino acid ABC transporter permease [Candidatus Sulfotelmatobacter sp.]|nr:branched-chain amino acid ABC transporter permease [Candidatus Sulfotelmatobacter sp.]
MRTLLTILVFGLASSGIYALMAVGVALIYGVGRIINFAHGAFYTLGAYFAYLYAVRLGVGWWIGAALAILTVAGIAVAFDRLLVEPIRHREIIVWIMTFAFAFAVRELIILTLGARPYSIPAFIPGSLTVLGQTIAAQRLLVVLASGLALAALWGFLYRTRSGKGLRAVALNPTGAHLVGIPVRRAHAAVMAISAGLAALAGIVISPIAVVTPDMGLEPLLMAFTIVILGGIGSLKGSLVAALIVGYAGALVSFLWAPELVTFMALMVVFSVILVRPTGLFGLSVERA